MPLDGPVPRWLSENIASVQGIRVQTRDGWWVFGRQPTFRGFGLRKRRCARGTAGRLSEGNVAGSNGAGKNCLRESGQEGVYAVHPATAAPSYSEMQRGQVQRT